MSMHKTGLHKDVSVIFNGVWNPEIDNIQPSFEEPAVNAAGHVQPSPIAANNQLQGARAVTVAKVFKAPANLFSTKRRREKKRLMSISKHLIINQSS